MIEIGQLSQNQYYALKLKLILNYYNQASIDLSDTKEKREIKSTKWLADFCTLPEEKILNSNALPLRQTFITQNY